MEEDTLEVIFGSTTINHYLFGAHMVAPQYLYYIYRNRLVLPRPECVSFRTNCVHWFNLGDGLRGWKHINLWSEGLRGGCQIEFFQSAYEYDIAPSEVEGFVRFLTTETLHGKKLL